MNQVKCPDCGETYCEDLQSCPNCGCPNDNWRGKLNRQALNGTDAPVMNTRLKKKICRFSHCPMYVYRWHLLIFYWGFPKVQSTTNHYAC